MQTEVNVAVSTIERGQALAEYLSIDFDDVSISRDDNEYSADGAEYLVLTDSEADERAKEYIKDSIWAFNASFLSGFTGQPEEVFTALSGLCEGANDAILGMIGNRFDELADDAIRLDGRGHFIAGYDGEENQSGDYFIYRTN